MERPEQSAQVGFIWGPVCLLLGLRKEHSNDWSWPAMEWQWWPCGLVSTLSRIQQRLGDHLLGLLQEGDQFRQRLNAFPTGRSCKNWVGRPVGKECNFVLCTQLNKLQFLALFLLKFSMSQASRQTLLGGLEEGLALVAWRRILWQIWKNHLNLIIHTKISLL